MDNKVHRVVVLHVIARMNLGGPAIEISELMSGLDDENIHQHLITGQCGPNEVDALDFSGSRLQHTKLSGLGHGVPMHMQIGAFLQLIRLIREIDPDIVHTHTTKAGVVGRIASLLSRGDRYLVHTYHGHLLHGYFSPALTQILILIDKVLARYTNVIISVSDKVRQELLDAGVGRSNQYRTFRSWSRFAEKLPKNEARALAGLEGSGPVIAFIGRLTRIKRPDRFLAVVEEVFKRGIQAQVVIAGGGELEDETRQAAEEKQLPIHFLGWRQDIDVVLAATDVLVVTSDNEGLPLVLLEAATLGVPFVASNVGGVAEVVAAYGLGKAVAPNTNRMADAVEESLSDPDMPASQLRPQRQPSLFTREDFLSQHADLYRSLTAEKSRSPN